jgi:branched-subunit amino acid transport protein
MDSQLVLWLTLLGMGLVTYAIRLGPILALERMPMPPRLRQALRFVPAAVLSAISLPELLRPGGTLDLSTGNDRLLAGILATAVAWFTRNVLLTIGLGMVALWVLQAF